jgi:acetoin utilization protein AcuB
MRAEELISGIVPVLHTSDTGEKALQLMEAYRISHLPIVNHKDFLGLISDSDIYDQNSNAEPIGNYKLSLFSPFVYKSQHIYEVIALVSKLKLTVIPVLEKNKEYLGVITISDLAQQFSSLTAVGQPGGIFILSMNITDYSLTEIARLVEGNDAKILSLYIQSEEGSSMIDVTVKVNSTNLAPILQTLERYNYQVKFTFLEDDELVNILENRYEEFMKYLSM